MSLPIDVVIEHQANCTGMTPRWYAPQAGLDQSANWVTRYQCNCRPDAATAAGRPRAAAACRDVPPAAECARHRCLLDDALPAAGHPAVHAAGEALVCRALQCHPTVATFQDMWHQCAMGGVCTLLMSIHISGVHLTYACPTDQGPRADVQVTPGEGLTFNSIARAITGDILTCKVWLQSNGSSTTYSGTPGLLHSRHSNSTCSSLMRLPAA
jgi:hypothetical protein